MSEKSLLIVASLAYDGIETKENKVDNILGGAGTYICLSLKHFSSEYSIISVVGNDFKSQDLNLLQSCGVDISGIKIEENDKTFYWSCIYTDNFKERITTKTELNVMANFNPVIPDEKSKPDILLLGNLHPEIQLSAINQLNNKPSAIILDTMNYWIENFWETVKEVISKVDIISINDEESEMITGQKDLTKAANILHTMGPKFVIIKKGEKGAELFNYEKRYVTGVFNVEKVLDPTGAGDCFIGGISGFLSESNEISFESIKSAIDYGTSLASFNVEEMGTKNLLNLSMNDVQTRVNKLK
ncbi:PfkB family carbohydrate kinase [Flavobacteriaceae bacterium]|nr:PfkB family carbohydrate kinase [Flavobacteriaceae bacterium]MDA9084361.1 PfkB family carbohydrate kinase [Flavobacteriaceae bacterium]MDB3874699.1 PfkB family carbohydrate kinase [Flavobacteriaceae bacterium]MDC0879148.1 PfkB family carbohydrate kinase [Flavobacteriaceae bacterium]MDC6462252.1 PfkB family carbohydrate kinase [Flavobacteriaceae bacterium]|tara:strand:- start:1146 stop:2048 length:903 start_codon:yes stop_codon:yes gene_type:complete